ncbi:FAD-dependent oxidoreductase [Microbacterium sp. JZ31]|uniref:FAD-dependent oxidoreductase n=1 Tax=Microbacterium sp. JZ31 TaxID=1906274 RepID=UPI0019321BC6|nr:NAD(P)/FAD-dependent oxidoreductase [Microbacterium sp. JZ31]
MRRRAEPPVLHDVAIVGAGAVGLLLACLLAARGLDVVVLDRRPEPGPRTRAIGIHAPGLAALDAAGVGAELRRAAIPIRGGVATCRGAQLAHLTFGDAVLSVPQQHTERLLEARLAALAPGALRRGVAVTDLRRRRGGVELALTGDGGRVEARIVVGADGTRSAVRERLGIAWRSRPGRAHYAMVDAQADTDSPADTALLSLEPDGVVESFPLPGGRRRWVARLPRPARRSAVGRRAPDAGESPDAAALAGILAQRVGTRITPVSEASAFTARQHLAAAFSRGRIALAGDAAHEVSPIGGQGMNLGWIDAVHLDRAIASGLRAGSPARALRRWGRRRRIAARRAMRRARFNMAMGAPARALPLHARNALIRVLATPPLRGMLTRSFTMRGL